MALSLSPNSISVPPVVLPFKSISANVSTLPTWLSTYALIDSEVATVVALAVPKVSSSKTAEPVEKN